MQDIKLQLEALDPFSPISRKGPLSDCCFFMLFCIIKINLLENILLDIILFSKMTVFHNRRNELDSLDRFYRRPGFQMIPVYGRRRVGKTRLLQRFLEQKNGVYLLGRQVAKKPQLDAFGTVVGELFNDPFVSQRGFGDWDQLFVYLVQKAEQLPQKLVVVLDEFPYLASSDKGISSIFQSIVDQILKESNIMLILAGSHMGMMEREVLGYRAPLYGRRTGQLKVKPLDFHDATRFYPGYSARDSLCLYAIAGGIPAYLERFSDELSVADNVISHFGSEEEFLAQEPEYLLRQELSEVRYYYSIVSAIARGHRKLGHIVNETGLDKAVVGKYLKTLIDLYVVSREVPILEKNAERSRKGLYRISDNLFDFYFRYIFPNQHFLALGRGAELWKKKIFPTFQQFVSLKAEEIARQLAVREFPEIERIGRHWNRELEVDIVGLDASGNIQLAGEVKWWQEKPVGLNVLRDLERKVWQLGTDPKQVKLLIYAAAGFTPELEATSVLLRDFTLLLL